MDCALSRALRNDRRLIGKSSLKHFTALIMPRALFGFYGKRLPNLRMNAVLGHDAFSQNPPQTAPQQSFNWFQAYRKCTGFQCTLPSVKS